MYVPTDLCIGLPISHCQQGREGYFTKRYSKEPRRRLKLRSRIVHGDPQYLQLSSVKLVSVVEAQLYSCYMW